MRPDLLQHCFAFLLILLRHLVSLVALDLDGLGRVQLLIASQIHVSFQQWLDVGIEGLPVWVVEVVFLGFLVQVSLDDGEVPAVVRGLHDEPRERLLVVRVDLRGLDQLGLDLGYAVVVLGSEVNYQCVDHDVGLNAASLRRWLNVTRVFSIVIHA